MTSQIDPTLPVYGTPTTASVRANFQTAHDEITALQTAAGAITATQVAISPAIGTLGANVQTGLSALNSGKAPIDSPPFTGNPTAPTPAMGDNDTSLATTAFVQAAVAPAFNGVGRNKLHNPLFNITQRGGGGFTAVTTGITFTADRWGNFIGASGDSLVTSIQPQVDANRAAIGDESAQVYLANAVTGGSGAGNYSLLLQKIEDVSRLSNKTVTVSFWAAASTALKLGVSLDQIFGSGGSPSAQVNGTGQAVTLSTSYARYSLTFSIPSLAGKTLGATPNTSYTELNFWFSSGTTSASRAGNVGVQSGTFALWGAQLETGSIATPLEKPDPRYDLANCQRSYQVGTVQVYQYGAVIGAPVSSILGLPVTMRALPTIVPNFSTLVNASGSAINVLSAAALLPNATATAISSVTVYGTFTASAEL